MSPELIDRLKQKVANEDGYVYFEGWTCADSWDEGIHCRGWDGESRRCDCGNRRVCWDTYTEGSEDPNDYFAVAY